MTRVREPGARDIGYRVVPRSIVPVLPLILAAAACAEPEGRGDDGPVGATAADSSDGGDESTDSDTSSSISVGSDDGSSTIDPDSGTDESSTGAPPVTMIDLHDVVIHDNPANVADWAVTTAITRLEFREGGLYVEFSKKDGDGRWPDIVPPGWDGPLQYTLGLVELVDGRWHGSAAMQYWYGLDVQGGNVAVDDQVAVNWYYDARWGELAGVQPELGETIGVFIVAGNVRGVLDGSQSPVQERSEIVVVPMPGPEGAVHDL